MFVYVGPYYTSSALQSSLYVRGQTPEGLLTVAVVGIERWFFDKTLSCSVDFLCYALCASVQQIQFTQCVYVCEVTCVTRISEGQLFQLYILRAQYHEAQEKRRLHLERQRDLF